MIEKMDVTSGQVNSEEEEDEIYLTSDLGEIPEDRRKAEQRNTADPTKQTYFPMQESLGERVVNRIRNILWFYNKKKISDFDNFDFLIFTARFNMLERQTRQRLMDPLAKCFGEEIYKEDDRLIDATRSRVHKYQAGEKERAILEKFKARAKDEKNTLFLVVGDEAHWGMGKSGSESGSIVPDEPLDLTTGNRKRPKTDKSGANSQFINCWDDSFPNVIVLLVTATGFNLKTTETRIIEQDVAVFKPMESGAEVEHRLVTRPERGRASRVIDQETKKDRSDFKEVYSLHNIKWAEGHVDKFVDGCFVKLKLPNKLTENPKWLRKIDEMDGNHEGIDGLYTLRTTENSGDALELLIQGPTEGELVIKDSTGSCQLLVLGKGEKYHIGFIRVEDLHLFPESKWKILKHFSVLTNYGEDVLMLEVRGKNVPFKNFLYWDKDHVTLRKPPHDSHASLPKLDDPGYIFLVEYYQKYDQIKIPEEYLSLNFFYNSMRNVQREHQLLRGDPFFTEMVKKVQKKKSSKKQARHESQRPSSDDNLAGDNRPQGTRSIDNLAPDNKPQRSSSDDNLVADYRLQRASSDDYLAADYSYFILLIDEMRKCSLKKTSSLKQILCDPEHCLGDFRANRDARIHQFIEEINKYNECIQPISADVFMHVINSHESNASDNLKAVEIFASSLGGAEEEMAFRAVLECLFFMNSSTLVETFKALQPKLAGLRPKDRKNKEKSFKDYINHRFHSIKEEILSESETYCLIDKVIQWESSSGSDGKMVVVRVTKAGKSDSGRDDKKDRHSPGNRFYSTLSLARQVASQQKPFRFEIIRDFDDFRLSDITKDMSRPKYRIFQRLQPQDCEFIDASTLQRCSDGEGGHPCADYDPFKPDECTGCVHVHREGCLEMEQPHICEYVDPAGEKCPCRTYKACQPLTCKNCDHFHKDIQDYNDCNTLPCILILVGKGRLGDTFPRSFCAMDLRLSSDELPYLTKVTQELGRLCRYAEKPHGDYVEPYAKLPYALIGTTLDKCLRDEALNNYPVLYCIFKEKNKVDMQVVVKSSEVHIPDKKMRLTLKKDGEGQEKQLAAAVSSSDHGNEDKHKYRILLEAEPQIGKTGVYLKTISLLQREICRDSEWEQVVDDDPCSDDEQENVETRPQKESEPEPANKWRYPFWKTMEDQIYPKKFHDGKYARTAGSKTVETPATRAQVNAKGRKANKPESIPLGVYRAYSKDHDACRHCSQDAAYEVSQPYICGMRIKISIPFTSSYIDLLERYDLMNSNTMLCGDSMSFSGPMSEGSQQEVASGSYRRPAAERTVQTWIFTPTYKRAYQATVNYRHTMVDEQNKKCYYKHFLVVREEEFKMYQKTWGGSHAILQLPNQMPDCEVDINGGIGYARLFIQRYALACDQNCIFMVDDNITSLHEIKTIDVKGTECVHREDGNLKEQNIPLFKVLKYLERQFSKQSMSIDLSLPRGFRPCREGTTRLEKYTGPAARYGALGIRKQRKGIQRVKDPFKKTNVYSLVLLNLQELQKQSIEYQPRTCREDMILYQQCIDQGLWVCKYNRFLLYKAMLKSHIIPDLFCWDDHVKILKSKKKAKKPSQPLDLTYTWLKTNYKPSRVELKTPKKELVDKRLIKLEKELKKHYELVRKIQDGSCHLLIYTAATLGELYSYFTTTAGIGGYSSHILILPLLLFIQNKMKNKSEMRRLVDRIFETCVKFEVYTTHDIASYECVFIILQVDGKIKDPKDQDQVPNTIQPFPPQIPVIPETGPVKQKKLAGTKPDKEVTESTINLDSHPQNLGEESHPSHKNGDARSDLPEGKKMDSAERSEEHVSSDAVPYVMEDISGQNPLIFRMEDGESSDQQISMEIPEAPVFIVKLKQSIIGEDISVPDVMDDISAKNPLLDRKEDVEYSLQPISREILEISDSIVKLNESMIDDHVSVPDIMEDISGQNLLMDGNKYSESSEQPISIKIPETSDSTVKLNQSIIGEDVSIPDVMEDVSGQNPLMERKEDSKSSEQPKSMEISGTSDFIVKLNESMIDDHVLEEQSGPNEEIDWYEELSDQELWMAYEYLNELHKFDKTQPEVAKPEIDSDKKDTNVIIDVEHRDTDVVIVVEEQPDTDVVIDVEEQPDTDVVIDVEEHPDTDAVMDVEEHPDTDAVMDVEQADANVVIDVEEQPEMDADMDVEQPDTDADTDVDMPDMDSDKTTDASKDAHGSGDVEMVDVEDLADVKSGSIDQSDHDHPHSPRSPVENDQCYKSDDDESLLTPLVPGIPSIHSCFESNNIENHSQNLFDTQESASDHLHRERVHGQGENHPNPGKNRPQSPISVTENSKENTRPVGKNWVGWSRSNHQKPIIVVDSSSESDEGESFLKPLAPGISYIHTDFQRENVKSYRHNQVLTPKASASNVQNPIGAPGLQEENPRRPGNNSKTKLNTDPGPGTESTVKLSTFTEPRTENLSSQLTEPAQKNTKRKLFAEGDFSRNSKQKIDTEAANLRPPRSASREPESSRELEELPSSGSSGSSVSQRSSSPNLLSFTPLNSSVQEIPNSSTSAGPSTSADPITSSQLSQLNTPASQRGCSYQPSMKALLHDSSKCTKPNCPSRSCVKKRRAELPDSPPGEPHTQTQHAQLTLDDLELCRKRGKKKVVPLRTIRIIHKGDSIRLKSTASEKWVSKEDIMKLLQENNIKIEGELNIIYE